MSTLAKTINAHFVHAKHGVLYMFTIEFAPRVGDELRFHGNKFFTVKRLVWIYDEPEAHFSRLNIEIVEA